MSSSLFRGIIHKKYPTAHADHAGVFDLKRIADNIANRIKLRSRPMKIINVDCAKDFIRLYVREELGVENLSRVERLPWLSESSDFTAAAYQDIGDDAAANSSNVSVGVAAEQANESSEGDDYDPYDDTAPLTIAQRNQFGDALRADILDLFKRFANDEERIHKIVFLALVIGITKNTLQKWGIPC